MVKNADYYLRRIKFIVVNAIQDNLKKTNKEFTPLVIKSYRESLLVLREIEKELNDYDKQVS